MIHRVTTAVTVELLTTALAKTYLRVDHSDDDTLIGGLVSAARSWIEEHTGRYIGAQTVECELSRDDVRALCQGHPLYLRGPVPTFTSLKVYDTADTETTVTSTLYEVVGTDPSRLVQSPEAAGITSQLTTLGVRKERAGVALYSAGYTTLATVPEGIAVAWRLLVSDFYHNRIPEGATGASPAICALLAPYRTDYVQ